MKSAEEKIPFFSDPDQEINMIKILNKNIPIYKRGRGSLSLIVLGPATLFQKPDLIPTTWNDTFTIYFADIFSQPSCDMVNYENSRLDDFVGAIENNWDYMIILVLFMRGQMRLRYS